MLTPEQTVAAIKVSAWGDASRDMGAGMTGRQMTSRHGTAEGGPWVTSPIHFESRNGMGEAKPPRVEAGQVWATTYGCQFTVVAPSGGGWKIRDQAGRECLALGFYERWTFLGYARPTALNPGQRWHNRAKGVIEIATVDEYWTTTTSGDRYSVALCSHPAWEYIGMADAASTEKAIEKVALVTGQSVALVRACAEDIQRRYSEPIQRGAAPTLPPDPKAEARRALEVTAKRLIDNPPAWAYQTGWMMAVLHQVEQRLSADRLAREFSPVPCFYGSVYEDLRTYQARRLAGQTHDTAKAGLNLPELCDVYARGMDIRAKPLLVRPVGIGRVR